MSKTSNFSIKSGQNLAIRTGKKVIFIGADAENSKHLVSRTAKNNFPLHLRDVSKAKSTHWAIDTRRNSIVQIDANSGIVPVWKPSFDCRLTGLAIENGKAAFVSGSLPNKKKSRKSPQGFLATVPDGEIILREDISLNSPKISGSTLFVLANKRGGKILAVDPAAGKFETVSQIPRSKLSGLAAFEDYIFVGISQKRKNLILSYLPIFDAKNFVGVVHVPSGKMINKFHCGRTGKIIDLYFAPASILPEMSIPSRRFWQIPAAAALAVI
ncbi:hypothetical protein GMMP15_1390003 [Candidatus Magnetomoraceae bacterium gMMP-15]